MSEETENTRDDGPPPDSAGAGEDMAAEGMEEAAGAAGDDRDAEVQRLRDQLLRTAADFDNFRKRTRRELSDAERRGREETIRDILPVIDNLERAAAAAETAQDIHAVAEGVQMVLRQFEEVGSRWGLGRVPTRGGRFDPNLHDAVQQVVSPEHEPGAIVNEVCAGYTLAGRLIRAAMVVVAAPPASAAPDDHSGDGTEHGTGTSV